MEETNNNIEQVNQQTQLETLPLEPTSPKQNKNIFKILFFISIFILITVIGVGIYYLTSNKKQETVSNSDSSFQTIEETGSMAVKEDSETKDWNTYKNESWGLSFKYPSTYTIIKNTAFEPSRLVHGEEGKGDLILEDKTREGSPALKFMFNPDGMGGPCIIGSNDYFYKTQIINNKINISEKRQNTNPPIDGCTDNLTPDILFDLGSYSNPGLDYSNFKNGIHARFSYSKGDYQSELDKIIESIEITKPEIYGQRNY